MVLVNEKFGDIYEGLKYNFLYKNDLNSIHILLNLYDLEEDIHNIRPRYISLNYIKKHMIKYLNNRRDNYLISLNLGQIIHESINRLELYICLEGYKDGYFNMKWVNKLEDRTVKEFNIERLYEMKYLFHFDNSVKEVNDLKLILEKEINEKEKRTQWLNSFVLNYCDQTIKDMVLNLNKHIYKQMTIDIDGKNLRIREEEPFLTRIELDNIYSEVVKAILKNSLILYKDSYWNGINDRVLNRYI